MQDHYDFGMRAIKSVLIMAGQKKRIVAYNRRFDEIEDSQGVCILFSMIVTFKHFEIVWGLPLTVLFQNAVKSHPSRLLSDQESYILIHALRDANVPKFLAEDVPLFESIMFDLFPGVEPPKMDNQLLEVIDRL